MYDMYDQGLVAASSPLPGSEDKLVCVQISSELVLRPDQVNMINSIKWKQKIYIKKTI